MSYEVILYYACKGYRLYHCVNDAIARRFANFVGGVVVGDTTVRVDH